MVVLHLKGMILLSKIIKYIVLAMTLIVINHPGVSAESTKTLMEDTKLHPAGWLVGDTIVFKGGTQVKFNDFGEVIEGTLASSEALTPVGWRGIVELDDTRSFIPSRPKIEPGQLRFKGGCLVSFNDRGEVVSGTLDFHEPTIYLHFPNKQGIVILKRGTLIKYHNNGALAEGILEKEKLLKPSGWTKMANNGEAGFIKFKEDTVVKFNDRAEVIEGTVKEDTKISMAGGSTKIYPAGTVVIFNDSI